MGHRIALAVGHGAIQTSCREGRSFFVGHLGQTVCRQLAHPSPRRPLGMPRRPLLQPQRSRGVSCSYPVCRPPGVCASGRPIPGRGGHMACCEAAPAASTVLWRPLPRPQRSHGILRSHPVISQRLQPRCRCPRGPGQTRRQLSVSRWRPAHPWPMRPFGAS